MKKPAWPKLVRGGATVVEIRRVQNAPRTHFVILCPLHQICEIATKLTDARAIAKEIIRSHSDPAAFVRRNARVDEFKLSSALGAADWQFYKLENGEHHMAWLGEAQRQIAGQGMPWLRRPAPLRKRFAKSYLARPGQSPVYKISRSFDAVQKEKAGHMLLALDIDCSYGIDSILKKVEALIKSDPAHKTPKRPGGRLNQDSYEIWLYRLAMTRLVHAFGNTRAQKESIRHWKKNIDAQELNKCRTETMTRLEHMKKLFGWEKIALDRLGNVVDPQQLIDLAISRQSSSRAALNAARPRRRRARAKKI